MKTIALIVPEYRTPQAMGGGLAALADFVEHALADPALPPDERLAVRFVVPRMYNGAPQHWSIRRPSTWRRGPVAERRPGSREIWDVGTWFPEVERNRYRPRKALTSLIDDCDGAIVVAGTPALGLVLADTRVPWVLEVASLVEEERAARIAATHGLRGLLLRLATASTRRADRSALRRPDAIVTINDTLAERLRALTDRPVRLLTPGIDTEMFRPASSRAVDGPIVMVSRLNDPRKDLPTLLRAFARARSDHGMSNRLVLAGRHRPDQSVLQLIDDLELVGAVDVVSSPSDEELAAILRGASCFALASREEGLGVVFLEAMASGLPVVTTATRGARFAIPPTAGVVLPFGASLVDEFAAALNEMTANTTRADAMGAAARQHAVQEFDRAVAAARWRALARELVQRTEAR